MLDAFDWFNIILIVVSLAVMFGLVVFPIICAILEDF